MAVDHLLTGTQRQTSVSTGHVDWFFIAAALATIVGSGTYLATPALIILGLVAAARMASGRKITSGWIFLVLPPLVYVVLGIANGQISNLSDAISASSNDFRVMGVIPALLYVATERQSSADARRMLSILVNGVTAGIAFSVAVSAVTSGHGSLPFSSHHALGFTAAATAITAMGMPSRIIAHRGLIVAISIFAVLTSGSRSGLSAAVVGLLAIPVLRLLTGQQLGWSIGRMGRLLVMIAALSVTASVVAPDSTERVTETVGSMADSGLNAAAFGRPSDSGKGVSEADRNVAVRLSIWNELSRNAPLTALVRVDAGSVDDLLSDSHDEVTHRVFSAHNLYLQLAVELGWLGMFMYVGVSSIGVRLLTRRLSPPAKVTVIAMWVAALVFGLTSNSLLSPVVMLPFAFFAHLLASDRE